MDERDGHAYAVIAGGGTGGHVYPALALAEELVARGLPRRAIRFVGTMRGVEARAVPEAGFEIDLLPGRGLQRRLTPGNLAALTGASVAFGRALALVRRLRPRVVVGVGGYASLPCVVAARVRRVPVVVHEQNAVPGLANRVAVRLGAQAAVSWPATLLRGARLVGNPVRAAVAGVSRAPSADRPLVLVFGGSLGSRRINEGVSGLYGHWRSRADVRIHHIAGRRDHAEIEAHLASVRRPGDTLEYRLVEYVDHDEEMAALYAQASVAVCRSGAVTVAELAAAGVPAVLVPLPGAPSDHQVRNAEALVAGGAAVLVPDAECTAERLATELDDLLGDAGRLFRMGEGARRLARPDAAARLADLVEEAAGG